MLAAVTTATRVQQTRAPIRELVCHPVLTPIIRSMEYAMLGALGLVVATIKPAVGLTLHHLVVVQTFPVLL